MQKLSLKSCNLIGYLKKNLKQADLKIWLVFCLIKLSHWLGKRCDLEKEKNAIGKQALIRLQGSRDFKMDVMNK